LSTESFPVTQTWQGAHFLFNIAIAEQNSLVRLQWWWPSQGLPILGKQCVGHFPVTESLALSQYWQGWQWPALWFLCFGSTAFESPAAVSFRTVIREKNSVCVLQDSCF
jgi:hypothetical protein